ncbi:bifunctional 2-polyprenyl-6-hydroxyphenol methylase/3-demethylubiquinol 3-O-methyltransferase UbiG [Desulfoluna sp.]|uniref:class I SAM-dependent methyltransferase n=1 Tax=Desulfoluna sp. TaxID=2045199 RepID=UPI002602AFF0|nr:class I SAM-dependent methyltransferase [Desulfoluna sp.]
MENQKLRDIWDQRAEIHAAGKEAKAQDPMSTLYHDSWWGYIQPLLSEIAHGRILEAGCGTGRWAEHLVPMGFDLVLSDFSPNMLAKARAYAEEKGFAHGVSFEALDVCDLHSLESDSFDMVISTGEPVSLCNDPGQAISEYCRVVRPGGYVLCDAGNRYRKAYDSFVRSPSGRAAQIIETGDYEMDNNMTLHLLGPSELTRIFDDLNMELLTLAGITPMFSFPPNEQQKKALEDEATYQAMVKIGREYARRPEIVALSNRLIAVARKLV